MTSDLIVSIRTVFEDQRIFMEACGQRTLEFDLKQSELYNKLVIEESKELDIAFAELVDEYERCNHDSQLGLDAVFDHSRTADVAKEAVDVIVVATGLLMSLGIDPQLAWDAVAESNRSKINPVTGKVDKREDGKVLKGPNYVAPDMNAVVAMGVEHLEDRRDALIAEQRKGGETVNVTMDQLRVEVEGEKHELSGLAGFNCSQLVESKMDIESPTLADALPNEIKRVRELLPLYDAIPTGIFAATMMRESIRKAELAISNQDTVAMLRCYRDLVEYTG